MDPDAVAELEAAVEDSLARLIRKLGRNSLPLVPSQHTFQMMAKAAVAVYEAAVENHSNED